MTKKMIIKEIARMMKECNDMELLHLIYLLLLKSGKESTDGNKFFC